MAHHFTLKEHHKTLSKPHDERAIDPVDVPLRYEAWVRGYLEDVGSDYGIEIRGDLDEEASGRERGDVKAIYEEEKVIIEVEKQVSTFFKHDHRTEGQRGWEDIGKIDMVFAASGERDKAREIPVPVIIANKDAPDGTDGFDEWYGKAKARDKVANEIPAEYIDILSNYMTVLLTDDFRRVHEMEDEADEYSDAAIQIDNIAMDALVSHVRTFLPKPENSEDVVEMIQDFDTHQDLVDTLFDQVIHTPIDNDHVFGECECGEAWFEICRGSQAPSPRLQNFDNMSEGQIAMALAGNENSDLVGGVVQYQVVVAYCPGCEIVTRLSRRVVG